MRDPPAIPPGTEDADLHRNQIATLDPVSIGVDRSITLNAPTPRVLTPIFNHMHSGLYGSSRSSDFYHPSPNPASYISPAITKSALVLDKIHVFLSTKSSVKFGA
ncbi:hypothetical protein V5O48_008154 [Marasmius crinis-equi]|uniref:Uncharacterized protein n=1 Tax=Marasmius crinis-equi TaxID=585013 RepID=A0ABR3FET5_9AGAR